MRKETMRDPIQIQSMTPSTPTISQILTPHSVGHPQSIAIHFAMLTFFESHATM